MLDVNKLLIKADILKNEISKLVSEKGDIQKVFSLQRELSEINTDLEKLVVNLYESGIINVIHRNPKNRGNDTVIYYLVNDTIKREYFNDKLILEKRVRFLMNKYRLSFGWVYDYDLSDVRKMKIKNIIEC